MNVLAVIFRELLGLFLDDRFLAIAVLAVILLAAGLSEVVPSIAVGSVLLVGCLVVLVISALRSAWKV